MYPTNCRRACVQPGDIDVGQHGGDDGCGYRRTRQ